jgi:hypothetical protein
MIFLVVEIRLGHHVSTRHEFYSVQAPLVRVIAVLLPLINIILGAKYNGGYRGESDGLNGQLDESMKTKLGGAPQICLGF